MWPEQTVAHCHRKANLRPELAFHKTRAMTEVRGGLGGGRWRRKVGEEEVGSRVKTAPGGYTRQTADCLLWNVDSDRLQLREVLLTLTLISSYSVHIYLRLLSYYCGTRPFLASTSSTTFPTKSRKGPPPPPSAA